MEKEICYCKICGREAYPYTSDNGTKEWFCSYDMCANSGVIRKSKDPYFAGGTRWERIVKYLEDERGICPGLSKYICFKIKFRFLRWIKNNFSTFHYRQIYALTSSKNTAISTKVWIQLKTLFWHIPRKCCRDISFLFMVSFSGVGIYYTFSESYLATCLGVVIFFIIKWKAITKEYWVWEKPVTLHHIQNAHRNSDADGVLHKALGEFLKIDHERLYDDVYRDNTVIRNVEKKLRKRCETYKYKEIIGYNYPKRAVTSLRGQREMVRRQIRNKKEAS